jgi:putative ABC transport system permease protein
MKWVGELARDLHVAARTLHRQPGFTAVAVTILALGLGGATTMFSIVDALFLRPLPHDEPDRLVRINRTLATDRSADSIDRLHAPGAYLAYRAQRDVFEAVAAIDMGAKRIEIHRDQPPELMLGAAVGPDYFTVFRVQPRLGRLFSPEEHQPGSNPVVLLSSQLWQSRFGSDPAVVGRPVRVDGVPRTVIGVMPPQLHDPLRYWSRGLLWTPLTLAAGAENDHQSHWLRLIARLSPDVPLASARSAVAAIAARLEADHPTRSTARLVTPQETGALDLGGERVVWLSMGLGVFVLLIACINLAGVQLARLATRGHDLAVRAALGAGRGRLMRQLITESVLLSALGGALGLLLAHWCTDLLAARITVGWRWVTAGLPAAVDGRVLGFALVLVLATAVVVGAVPAWLSARQAVGQALRSGGRGTPGGGGSWPRLRQALVISEMGLALTLLAAGGLFLRGLQRFVEQDLGWDADGLLTARIDLPGPGHRGEQGATFLEELQRRLAALPGVESAAVAGDVPIWENGQRPEGVWLQETPRPRPGEGPAAFANAVSPDYFRTLGLARHEGRLFTAADRLSQGVVIINASMARELWPGQSALGKRLGDARGDPQRANYWRTVVGVPARATSSTCRWARPTAPP